MTVIRVLSGAEGGALVSPGVSWIRRCLIYEVTKGASGFGTIISPCVAASRVGFTMKAFSVEASTEMSIAPESMIDFFA